MIRCLLATLRVLALAGMSLVGIGCASGTSDTEFRLEQSTEARAHLERELRSEQAKTVALTEQLGTARAKASALRDECEEKLAALRAANRELLALVDESEAPLAAPTAHGGLPSAVDAGLTALAEQHSGRVTYRPQRGAMSLANDALFSSGSDQVRSEARPLITRIGEIVRTLPAREWEIIVVGHTDNTPIRRSETRAAHPTNWHLSVHRAIAVKDLLADAGVPSTALAVMGYGPFRPLGADRSMNRRVEIFIVPRALPEPREPVRPAT